MPRENGDILLVLLLVFSLFSGFMIMRSEIFDKMLLIAFDVYVMVFVVASSVLFRRIHS